MPLCAARGLAAAACGGFTLGSGALRAGDFALARFEGVGFFAGGGDGDGDRFAAGDAWDRRVERGGMCYSLSEVRRG